MEQAANRANDIAADARDVLDGAEANSPAVIAIVARKELENLALLVLVAVRMCQSPMASWARE